MGVFVVLVVFILSCSNCVMYIYQLSLLLWASYRHFKDRLPEAICCCLQTCSVDVVLLVMCCMCIPVFIVTSAPVMGIFYNILPEASCCLQTCNVYGAWVTL